MMGEMFTGGMLAPSGRRKDLRVHEGWRAQIPHGILLAVLRPDGAGSGRFVDNRLGVVKASVKERCSGARRAQGPCSTSEGMQTQKEQWAHCRKAGRAARRPCFC